MKTQKILLVLLVPAILFGCKPDTPEIPKTLLLWHSYEIGSVEETILSALVQKFITNHPGWEIDSENIPYDKIDQKYRSAVESGAGPDLIIRRNDILGDMVRSGLISDITEETPGKLSLFTQNAIDGMTYDDKIYGFPFSSQTDVLFYNRDLVNDPPRTTDEILELIQNDFGMTMHLSAYHLFGWPGAFGGKLMDETGLCIADQGGWIEAANFLLAMKDTGVVFTGDFTETEAPFRLGQTAFMINGPWAIKMYRDDLGESLGAISLPAGLVASMPLQEMEGIYINPNTKNKKAASELALFLIEKESQTLFMEYANHIPVRTDVKVHDPIIQAFVTADINATVRPQMKEFSNYWTFFNNMWEDILLNDIDPTTAVTEACDAMNLANNK